MHQQQRAAAYAALLPSLQLRTVFGRREIKTPVFGGRKNAGLRKNSVFALFCAYREHCLPVHLLFVWYLVVSLSVPSVRKPIEIGRLYFTGNFYLLFYEFRFKCNPNSNADSKTISKSNPNPNPISLLCNLRKKVFTAVVYEIRISRS